MKTEQSSQHRELSLVEAKRALENYALWYLARYGQASTAQFRRKLEQKIARLTDEDHRFDGLVDEVVEKARSLALIDDAQVARARINKLKERGWSPARIRQDLRQRGIEQQKLSAALDEEGDLEFQAALRLAQRRKIGPWRLPGSLEGNEYAEPSGSQCPNARTNQAEVGRPCPATIERELKIFGSRGFSYAVAKRIIESVCVHELM